MLPEERAFPTFAFGVIRDLYRASISNPDVFLITMTGFLLGGRTRRQRGLGTGIGLYVTFRRLDQYFGVLYQAGKRLG